MTAFFQKRKSAVVCLFLLFACASPGGRVGKLSKILEAGRKPERIRAVQQLGNMGPEALPAAPALVKALNDEADEVNEGAADVLVALGPGAVPALLVGLDQGENVTPCRAALVLGRLGSGAAEAVPKLLAAAQRQDICFPGHAIKALAALGEVAAPALVKAVSDGSWQERQAAQEALIRMEQRTVARHLQPLMDNFKSQDDEARGRAAMALSRLGPAASAGLLPLLDDPDAELRRRVIEVLGELEGAGAEVVPGLVRRFNDPQNMNRLRAAAALGRLAAARKDVLNALAPFLQDKDPQVRRFTAMALGHVGPRGSAAAAGLIKALSDKDKDVADEAAEALMKIETPEAVRAARGYLRGR